MLVGFVLELPLSHSPRPNRLNRRSIVDILSELRLNPLLPHWLTPFETWLFLQHYFIFVFSIVDSFLHRLFDFWILSLRLLIWLSWLIDNWFLSRFLFMVWLLEVVLGVNLSEAVDLRLCFSLELVFHWSIGAIPFGFTQFVPLLHEKHLQINLFLIMELRDRASDLRVLAQLITIYCISPCLGMISVERQHNVVFVVWW